MGKITYQNRFNVNQTQNKIHICRFLNRNDRYILILAVTSFLLAGRHISSHLYIGFLIVCLLIDPAPLTLILVQDFFYFVKLQFFLQQIRYFGIFSVTSMLQWPLLYHATFGILYGTHDDKCVRVNFFELHIQFT